MKKFMPLYAIGWLLALGLFNLIVFVTPGDKFDYAMWTISYILITVFFLVLLGCSYYVFSANKSQNVLYRLPLLKKSVGALVAVLVVGSFFLGVDGAPTWLGVIISAVVVFLVVMPMLSAGAASGIVEKIDQDVKQQTVFIKVLVADAQVLMNRAQGTANADATRRVYEAARYSDPMSSQGLADVENRIRTAFNALSAAVASGEAAEEQATFVLNLIEERNIKCKILK